MVKRSTAYSDALAKHICNLVAEGESLETIAKLPGMPARRTTREWIESYMASS
jgi:hypothetical protein